MARRRRGFLPAKPWLAVRGLCAVVVIGLVAALLVGRASGNLDPVDDVYVGIPVDAGLINTQAPVRYHGVNIGRIDEIESGTETSMVRLAIDKDALPLVPESVVARVVPRTFFGDIYLQLADGRHDPSDQPLQPGATISIDDSADAMALYDVFTKIVDVFSQIKPEKMQGALTALSQGLRGRGGDIGATIDDLSEVADTLTPSAVRFLDATPQFRDVMESLHTATPDIITTLSSAAEVSTRMLEDRDGVFAALDSLTGLSELLTPFLADHHEQLITIVSTGGKVLSTTAANPQGLVDTLSGAKAFGDAGSRAFSTGKFNITAVATFSGPMPYSAADCPVYGQTYGAHCADSDPSGPAPNVDLGAALPAANWPTVPLPHFGGPAGLAPPARLGPAQVPAPASAPGPPTSAPRSAEASGPGPGETSPVPSQPVPEAHFPAEVNGASSIVGGAREAQTLALLEHEVLGQSRPVGADPHPNIATVVMLGPLVRGTEVRVG